MLPIIFLSLLLPIFIGFSRCSVVKVNEKNLPQELERIKASIDSCHFMSVDLELGGFLDNHCRHRESVTSFYKKKKVSIEAYSMLQFGLTTVEIGVNSKFLINSWSLYLREDKVVKINPSAGEFLIRSGFDFSAYFKNTIPMFGSEDATNSADWF